MFPVNPILAFLDVELYFVVWGKKDVGLIPTLSNLGY